MIRRPPRSTPLYSSAASDVYKRQAYAWERVFLSAATTTTYGHHKRQPLSACEYSVGLGLKLLHRSCLRCPRYLIWNASWPRQSFFQLHAAVRFAGLCRTVAAPDTFLSQQRGTALCDICFFTHSPRIAAGRHALNFHLRRRRPFALICHRLHFRLE